MRPALVVGWVAWLVLGVLGVVAIQLAGPTVACEHESGDSTYGELSWSLVPPGHACTWTVDRHGLDDREGPSPVGSIWALGVLVGPVAYVGLRRSGNRPRSRGLDDPHRA